MIMSLRQREIKIKPGIKSNHNRTSLYKTLLPPCPHPQMLRKLNNSLLHVTSCDQQTRLTSRLLLIYILSKATLLLNKLGQFVLLPLPCTDDLCVAWMTMWKLMMVTLISTFLLEPLTPKLF